ncbi:leukotriene-a4 hydrolase [Phaffia rhodozyma]|uniref:Leukotriene-a4 hydrolase n=1 Tax=Phaffia rhodozyma TaxID=264483 RepID=A0A0F7SK11_PHARH|nr:leukotriene-a4 hydrolase [Phaffia rhodozyma]
MATHHQAQAPAKPDHATFSNYLDVLTTHFDLDWEINWKDQIIGGHVLLEMVVLKQDGVLDEVRLDTRDVSVGDIEVDGVSIKDYKFGERHDAFGSVLHIPIPKTMKYIKDDKLSVKVTYSTTKNCSALGWLTAEQTSGGKHPYLYSQSQAIHARSLFPCQDTPSVKSTYSATVKSTLPVLLSASRISPRPEEPIEPGKDLIVFKFNQPIKIPAYLVAIASGNLAYKAFKGGREGEKGWSTGVWTEPENLDAAHWEFSEDTANFVKAAEKLTGRPYVWGSYDVLLLPPAFPYGGMENPQITFATPTLLAGDRSLVDVIAHEISHSWFGNEIGCADWSHFWLNEGFTTYLERLIMQEVHGPAARGLSYIIGKKAMDDSLKEYEEAKLPRFQRLVVDYHDGEDPDDAFSSIPYNKGANFLLYLEQTMGGLDAFLPYIHSYVDTFAGLSISTEQWREHLYAFWKKHGGHQAIEKLDAVDWDGWLNGEGLKLPVAIEDTYDTSLADLAFDLAARWEHAGSDPAKLSEFKKSDIEKFEGDQTVVFLEKLQSGKKPMGVEAVRRLDEVYGLSKAGNAELSSRFFEIALASGDEYAKDAAHWVTDKGRMKFCRTIYRALFKVTPELAIKTFKAHSGFYHPIARRMIEKDLGLLA